MCPSPLFWLRLLLVPSLAAAFADVNVPPRYLEPQSAPEAWNLIRLSTANVDILLQEGRLEEIPVQISFCSPALRLLARSATASEGNEPVQDEVSRALGSVNAVARSAQEADSGGVRAALGSLRMMLDGIGRRFAPKIIAADVFVCPMHADHVSPDRKAGCAKCGMDLLKRRLPYSFIYTKPGAPTVQLEVANAGTMIVGSPMEVTVRLRNGAGHPVGYADLIEMHTEYIHLLIEEPGLGDYHHEHPKLTDRPGEYRFQFKPRKPGPYRIWADIIPAATGIQELPHTDLPGGPAEHPTDTDNRFVSSLAGYRFVLELNGGNFPGPKVGEPKRMRVTINSADGEPVTRLQPVMNAFAHLVGFHEDYETVLHLHPLGGEVLDQALRGGPSLEFLLYPPKPGFVRLYCQVMIDDVMLFAPFNLNIRP